jgi:hypothetical protein
MADPKRFLTTEIGMGCYGEFFHNTCGKPLNVTIGAQAISTDRNACMSISVGLGTTVFGSTLGISSGNFKDYFGTTGPGANPTGFNTTFGTFYLGKNCNCPGGSYCSSTSGIASFIAADGTETKNWQGGFSNWNCCICICAGPFPDGTCSSYCANAPWGGQEQINFALAGYHEYTGGCWDSVWPYAGGGFNECQSAHLMGYTNGNVCTLGPCRKEPTEVRMVNHCHGETQCKASQTWVNHFCCCGKCNYENSSPGTMAICYQRNDYNCGGYYDWYVITNNLPTSEDRKPLMCTWCCNGCQICYCNHMTFNCWTTKSEGVFSGSPEIFLNSCCRGDHYYCICFCNQCGRLCRQRFGGCCISQFTDCSSWICCLCCYVHWDANGWACNGPNSCPMHPLGGVAGAMTHCMGVRHHKTMQQCQMWYTFYPWACTFYCNRCSCNMRTMDLWVCPPKYGTTQCSTNEYAIKYLSWNPAKCCTYLMIRSEDAAQCGIFSWFGSDNYSYRDWQVGNGDLCCVWPCDSTYFCKVANFPSAMTEEKYYSPIMCTTCIHRVEKSLWAMGVYNCVDEKMDPFISSDLINWAKSPSAPGECTTTVICSDPANCIVEYMSTTCKWRQCTSFDGAVCKSGIVDWKLAFNNYERTGYIIPDGGRLFVQNIASGSIGTSFALNMWGYEG